MPHLLLLSSQHFVCGLHPLYQFTGVLVDLLRNMVGEVVRYPSLSTEHQEVRSLTSTDVWRAAESTHHSRQHRILFLLTMPEE